MDATQHSKQRVAATHVVKKKKRLKTKKQKEVGNSGTNTWRPPHKNVIKKSSSLETRHTSERQPLDAN